MKARTLRIARGEEQPSPDDPKVWFISTDPFPRSVGTQPRNAAPDRGAGAGFLDALAELTGRAKSNLSRTLKAMVGYGLIRMERSGKKLAPKLVHDRVVLELALASPRRKASRSKETADE
jgi:predicted transcriptional regulator